MGKMGIKSDVFTRFTNTLEWIESQKDRMLSSVQKWSAINTGSDNLEGIQEFSECLKKEFNSFDAKALEIALPDRAVLHEDGTTVCKPVAPALSFVKRPDAPFKILLSAHLDTVYPKNSPFQKCSFPKEGVLRGPGVADIKGGIAVILIALEAFERFHQTDKIGWEVFLNPDEEVGSVSSASELNNRAAKSHLGLIYEPPMPGGVFASERMGSASVSIVVRGKSAHVGRDFDKGESAILAAVPLIQQLQNFAESHPDVIFNIGRLVGGTAPNVVPEVCVLKISIRAKDQSRMQETLVAVENLVRDHDSEFDTSYQFHLNSLRPPKVFDGLTEKLFNELKECAEALKIPISWQSTGGVCDGNILAAAGLPTIDTLGVEGGQIHTHEEFLIVDSLTQRAALSALLLAYHSDVEETKR